jgi:hypothetical protein
MKLDAIRKKAIAGTLEVEHLLAAAKQSTPDLASELRLLSAKLKWPSEGLLPDGSRVVPLAKWAEVVALYASGGYNSLTPVAADPANVAFVLGLLEELKTREALSFLLEAYAETFDTPALNLSVSLRVASALNLMLSFKPSAPITPSQASRVQTFLLGLYPHAEREGDRATIVLALRGVGDERTLAFISGLPSLAEPWGDVKATTLRSIRKRIRENAF